MVQSIKSKLLISQLGLIFFIALVLSVTSNFLMVSRLQAIQKKSLEFIADDVVMRFRSYLSVKKNLMERIAEGKSVMSYRERYLDRALAANFVNYREEFPVLSYVSEKGMEEVKVINGELSRDWRDISQSDVFRKALEERNKAVVSSVESSSELGVPVIRLALAKYGYFEDEFIGIILGTLPLAEIAKAAAQIKVAQSGFVSVINTKGDFVIYSGKDKIPSRIAGEGIPASRLISDAKALKRGFGRATIFGCDGLVAYVPVEEMGWSVMVTLPYDEFVKLPNEIRNTSIVIFLVVFFLGMLVASFQASRITQPLAKLVSLTEKISQGDFDQKADNPSKDEIGVLGRSFDRMAQDLKKSHEELLSAKEYLSAIIDNMISSVMVLTPEGKIRMANPATYSLLGYERNEELIGQPFDRIFPKEDFLKNGGVTLLLKPSLSDEGNEYCAKDGRLIPVILSASVIRTMNGDVEAIICVAQDITERRRMEEDLRKNLADLQQFKKVAIDRENKMIELKKEVNGLSQKLGIPPPYDLSFLT